MTSPIRAYEPGDRIVGRWKVRAVLGGEGKSGMGIVYVVQDALDGTLRAAKTFQPELTADPEVREALHREASIWAQLGAHPNIVRVTHVEPRGEQLFVLMEYVEPDDQGRATLSDHLEGEPLAPDLLRRWARDLCRGMAHAERNGLKAHRDLKPDNVLISGKEGRLKITDFGLSQVRPPGTPVSTQTGARPGLSVVGHIVGTPGYIAPEVVKSGAGDIRGDVYGFGLILHQMLTGDRRPPLTGTWRGDAFHYEQQNLILRKCPVAGLGSRYDAVLRRCLAYAPEERFRSFSEVLEALEQAAGPATQIRSTHSGSSRESDLWVRAQSLWGLGRYEEALVVARERRDAFGPTWSTLNLEGTILCDLGRHEEALALFDRALEEVPDHVVLWNNKGRSLRRLGRHEEAIRCYDRAIAIDEGLCPPWISRGNSLLDLGRAAEAKDSFLRALALDDRHWAALYGLGKACASLGELDRARDALHEAMALEPDDASLRALFEQVESAASAPAAPRPRAASRQPGAAEDDHGGSREDLILAAQARRGVGRLDEALAMIREARRRFGEDAELWNDEGVYLTELRLHEEAIGCLSRSIALNPDWVAGWSNLGRAFREVGQYEEALRCYDRAIAVDPNERVPWENKANCLDAMGRHEEARTCRARIPGQVGGGGEGGR